MTPDLKERKKAFDSAIALVKAYEKDEADMFKSSFLIGHHFRWMAAKDILALLKAAKKIAMGKK